MSRIDIGRSHNPSATLFVGPAQASSTWQACFEHGTAFLRSNHYQHAEAWLREAIRLGADTPQTFNNLGTTLWLQRRPLEAEPLYRQALQINARHHGALTNLGNLLWDQKRPEEAALYYQSALEIEPNSPEASLNLGVALSDLGRFDEASSWLTKATELSPHWPAAYTNLGMNLARLGQTDDAAQCYQRALELDPRFAEAERNLGFIRLARGDFARGWQGYEARLRCRNHHGLRPDLPRWDGSPLRGQSILLHSEQGFGDCIQFVRFAAIVKKRGGRVLLVCAGPLTRLLAQCPYIDEIIDAQSPIPGCDFHAPLLSLPAIFRTEVASIPSQIPYLTVDHASRSKWQRMIENALSATVRSSTHSTDNPKPPLRVGIAWQGNPQNQIDRFRSIPIEHFAPLAMIPQVKLFCLQVGKAADELAQLENAFPILVIEDHMNVGKLSRDFLDTAAIMRSLDLVICPDTAVAHLAGALGVPIWVALSLQADWRWQLDRESSPWYPSMRIFRQGLPNDWTDVFQRMALALQQQSPLQRDRTMN